VVPWRSFKKDDNPVEFEPTVAKMLASVQKFNVDKVNKGDITRMGVGGAAEPDEE